MAIPSHSHLSDRELLNATERAAQRESRSTAELIALLAELDSRKLYLEQGCSSLFTYCTQVLHLSEPAAYSRITAARATRSYPTILARLATGEITLSTIALLAGHLTQDNCEPLLDAARHQSKRDVERLIACLHPQPDIAPSVRKVPAFSELATTDRRPLVATLSGTSMPLPDSVSSPASCTRSTRPSVTAPLAPERYLMRLTIGADTHEKLQRARDLLRHSIPSGDPAAVLDRALTVLIEQLEKAKAAATPRPRQARASMPSAN